MLLMQQLPLPRGAFSASAALLLVLVSALLAASSATPYDLGLPGVPHTPPISTRPPDSPASRNLIDVLSASPDHSLLVRLLQRTRLIPTLNRLQSYEESGKGITILAPNNEAILKRADEDKRRREESLPSSAARWVADPQFRVASSSEHSGSTYEVDSLDELSLWEWAVRMAKTDWEESKDVQRPVWRPQSWHSTAHENVHASLRQELLYHILNFTLPYSIDNSLPITLEKGGPPISPPLLVNGKPIMLETIHLPSRRLLHEPTKPGPIPHPPSGIPHPGDEDVGGLLGGEGQKLRVARKPVTADDIHSRVDTDTLYFGVDQQGRGGSRGLREDRSSNFGVVISIDKVLELPPSLETALRTDPRLAHLTQILSRNEHLLETLSTTAHLTLFLPTSKGFGRLSDIERRYLNGTWSLAAQDRLKMIGWHSSGIGIGDGKVAYAERLRKVEKADLTTILGGQIRVVAPADKPMEISFEHEGTARIIEEDILVENGIIHVIDNVILPQGDLALTVEKTLLALNSSRFVELMHSAGLESYINQPPRPGPDDDEGAPPVKPYTFLVPRDDVLDKVLDQWRRTHLAASGATALDGYSSSSSLPGHRALPAGHRLQDLMRYHVVSEPYQPSNLSSGMLLGTEFRNWRLRQAPQRVRVDVDDVADEPTRYYKAPPTGRQGDVGFGDANVIWKPVLVGESVVYLISQLLSPPASPIQTAVSDLSLSTFVAACSVAELDKALSNAPGVTLLVPNNDAFTALGLTMSYLLLAEPKARQELRDVVEYHAVDRILYRSDFAASETRYPTLEGSEMWASKAKNGTIEVRRGTGGRNARVVKADLLTSTGVIHEIDQVELPPTLDLTIDKLMRGAKVATMIDLVRQVGYGYILNGTLPATLEAEALDDDLRASKNPGGKKHHHRRKGDKEHKRRHKMLRDTSQAYVVLCPTDAAFTRINLTRYLADPEALRKLVQLHIIPSRADQVLPDGGAHTAQLPIGLRDAVTFPTLLDRSLGGSTRYGQVAFRRTEPGEAKVGIASEVDTSAADEPRDRLGWLVGIVGSRGTTGKRRSANVLAFGRESLRAPKEKKDGENGDSSGEEEDVDGMWAIRGARRQVPAQGQVNSRSVGGILTLDGVLEPYEPSWFYRWGWILLVVVIIVGALAAAGLALYHWWHPEGRIRLMPDAMEGEED